MAKVLPAPAGQEWRALARQLPTQLRFGVSTWSYPGWEGLVWDGEYDSSTLSRHGLGAYHQHPLLRTVCVDRTFWRPLTLEQYMEARVIADPIHLFDCVMPCAGAEGYLVMRREQAEALGLPYVRIRSTIERHNAFPEDAVQHRGGWAMDKDAFYEHAGLTPADVDFMETYDDYPVINVLQFEDLGFCAKGEGPEFIRKNTFTVDGSFPLGGAVAATLISGGMDPFSATLAATAVLVGTP